MFDGPIEYMKKLLQTGAIIITGPLRSKQK